MTGRMRERRARIGLLVVVVAAMPLAALLDGGDPHRTSAATHDGAPRADARAAASRGGPRVAYAGATRLRGPVVLRARVRARGPRVAAVTFRVDGRVVGTDATPPYRLDLPGGALRRGPHRVSVRAIDRVGRLSTTRTTRVRVLRAGRAGIRATPTDGLDRALAALRGGNATVRLAPGRYELPMLRLGPRARLIGSGPRTVIAPEAGSGPWAQLEARTRGVRISDLAIDGAGRAERGVSVGDGASDVRLQRLTIGGIRETGVEIWGAQRDVSVQDSTIAGGEGRRAGVFVVGQDGAGETSVVRTAIRDFDHYGINFAQRFYDRPRASWRNLALDNRISDIETPEDTNGRSEGGIWSGGAQAAIIGNRVRGAGTDAIQTVGTSTGVSVVRNDVAGTPVGIYLEHSTNGSLFARNRIADVDTGVNVEWRYGGVGSADNELSRNTIVDARESALFIDVGADGHRVIGNRIVRGGRPAIVLQGAHGAEVRDNEICGTVGEPVREQPGRHDDGELVQAQGNRIAAHRSEAWCRRRR